jgi:hypothetical protein
VPICILPAPKPLRRYASALWAVQAAAAAQSGVLAASYRVTLLNS